MYCSTSVIAQLVRGALAMISIAGAIMFIPHFWPAMGCLAWTSISCADVLPAGLWA